MYEWMPGVGRIQLLLPHAAVHVKRQLWQISAFTESTVFCSCSSIPSQHSNILMQAISTSVIRVSEELLDRIAKCDASVRLQTMMRLHEEDSNSPCSPAFL